MERCQIGTTLQNPTILEGYKNETMREKRQTSLGGPRAQISGWKNRAP